MAKVFRRRKKKGKKTSIKPEFIKLRKWAMSLFLVMLALMVSIHVSAQEQSIWHRADKGIDEPKVIALCVIKDAPNIVFAGGRRAIYKSVDYGENWYSVFMLRGERKGVNFITYDPSDSRKIFAATADGLYISCNGGKNWKRHFKGKGDLQRYITCVAVNKKDSNIIYIGTKRGLFISNDGGKNWSADKTFINKNVKSVVNNKTIYVCAVDGVYKALEAHTAWQRIYVVKASDEQDINENFDNGDIDELERFSSLSHLAVHKDKIYLATDRGIYTAMYSNHVWEALPSEAMLTKKTKFILPVKNRLFVATAKGIFLYDDKSKMWADYSDGLPTLRVNMLDISLRDNLIFTATDKGLFKSVLAEAELSRKNPEKESYRGVAANKEPSISEVQHAAIEYAEVSPDKIKWMRSAASNKALLPKVSFGLDADVYRTIDIDRGSTTIPDFYIEGPRDKNWGWDVDFSWDLGELIWNDDQANIDVRSRLMVQLRNDILDEVTKLYFERRRLQLELQAAPSKSENQRLRKQLRLDELTANIDGLTGGYLSKQIKR